MIFAKRFKINFDSAKVWPVIHELKLEIKYTKKLKQIPFFPLFESEKVWVQQYLSPHP